MQCVYLFFSLDRAMLKRELSLIGFYFLHFISLKTCHLSLGQVVSGTIKFVSADFVLELTLPLLDMD